VAALSELGIRGRDKKKPIIASIDSICPLVCGYCRRMCYVMLEMFTVLFSIRFALSGLFVEKNPFFVALPFILKLATRPGFAWCMLIPNKVQNYACYIHINFPLESLYLLKKHQIHWVLLKIQAYIGTDSGKQLCFLLFYDKV
jgi:hypothetical protein